MDSLEFIFRGDVPELNLVEFRTGWKDVFIACALPRLIVLWSPTMLSLAREQMACSRPYDLPTCRQQPLDRVSKQRLGWCVPSCVPSGGVISRRYLESPVFAVDPEG